MGCKVVHKVLKYACGYGVEGKKKKKILKNKKPKKKKKLWKDKDPKKHTFQYLLTWKLTKKTPI